MKKNVEIYPYPGGNDTIDKFRSDDEELWVVNASKGRKMMILPPGSTQEDAWNLYEKRFLSE